VAELSNPRCEGVSFCCSSQWLFHIISHSHFTSVDPFPPPLGRCLSFFIVFFFFESSRVQVKYPFCVPERSFTLPFFGAKCGLLARGSRVFPLLGVLRDKWGAVAPFLLNYTVNFPLFHFMGDGFFSSSLSVGRGPFFCPMVGAFPRVLFSLGDDPPAFGFLFFVRFFQRFLL